MSGRKLQAEDAIGQQGSKELSKGHHATRLQVGFVRRIAPAVKDSVVSRYEDDVRRKMFERGNDSRQILHEPFMAVCQPDRIVVRIAAIRVSCLRPSIAGESQIDQEAFVDRFL